MCARCKSNIETTESDVCGHRASFAGNIHEKTFQRVFAGCEPLERNGKYGEHPDFIPQTRELLEKIGKPYIIENVDGAPLQNPIALYGSQFKNLYTQRKRLFESNIELKTPDTPMVQRKTPTAGNGFGEDGFIAICGSGGVRGMNSRQIPLYWGFALGGIDWMTRAELAEAIPPAYTEFLGKQLIEFIRKQEETK